ncbi:MAG: omptin family outer membrane protease [Spirochaetaceae bacterium]|nr:omptin family outer membrane protease [Spirochaetaceae bacterium]
MFLLKSLRQRRFSITLLLLLFIPLVLSAAEYPERGWTVGPSIGVHWGTAYEIVYDNSGVENDNDYLSLLTWDLQPVVTLGFESLWESGGRISLDLDFRSAIPGMATGSMNDYDWFYTDRDWSHWSSSDVNLRWGFIIDAVSNWQVVETGPFSLKLGAGYHLDWWAWRDSITDSVYSDTNGPSAGYPMPYDTDGAVQGAQDLYGDDWRGLPDYLTTGINGINYETAYHVPLISLTINLNWSRFFINANGRIGPVLAFSHDQHVLRTDFGPDGGHFYDSAAGGPWVDATLETGFRSSGHFLFTLRGEYAWLNETRGNTIVVPTDGSSSWMIKDAAGFAFHRIGVTAIFSWDLSGS